jgi:hypothetical protein
MHFPSRFVGKTLRQHILNFLSVDRKSCLSHINTTTRLCKLLRILPVLCGKLRRQLLFVSYVPEDKSDMFFGNVAISSSYKVLHPKNHRNHWISGCPEFWIQENTAFRKPDMFQSSDEWREEPTLFVPLQKLTSIHETVFPDFLVSSSE